MRNSLTTVEEIQIIFCFMVMGFATMHKCWSCVVGLAQASMPFDPFLPRKKFSTDVFVFFSNSDSTARFIVREDPEKLNPYFIFGSSRNENGKLCCAIQNAVAIFSVWSIFVSALLKKVAIAGCDAVICSRCLCDYLIQCKQCNTM